MNPLERRGLKNLSVSEVEAGDGPRRIVRIYYRSEGNEILCCHSGPLSVAAADKLAAEHRPWNFVDAKGPSDAVDAEILRVVCVKDRPRYDSCTCVECVPIKHDARLVVLPSQRR